MEYSVMEQLCATCPNPFVYTTPFLLEWSNSTGRPLLDDSTKYCHKEKKWRWLRLCLNWGSHALSLSYTTNAISRQDHTLREGKPTWKLQDILSTLLISIVSTPDKRRWDFQNPTIIWGVIGKIRLMKIQKLFYLLY